MPSISYYPLFYCAATILPVYGSLVGAACRDAGRDFVFLYAASRALRAMQIGLRGLMAGRQGFEPRRSSNFINFQYLGRKCVVELAASRT